MRGNKMSMGFAEKLSYRKEAGAVGMTEIFDPPEVLQRKIQRLAVMIVRSRHLVAFTGAGISTSSGIPDFRGPKGVWTLQSEGKGVPEASVPFHRAVPSMTHMALVALEKAGFLKYLRDFEVETIGMKTTPRRCSDANCGSKLKDTVLDWEGKLPQKEMSPAEKHCQMADVVLCLGTRIFLLDCSFKLICVFLITYDPFSSFKAAASVFRLCSLQITPACYLPLQSLRGGGRIVIVNLQETPMDKRASLVIHGLVDKVIAGVMDHLTLKVSPFVRVDFFQIRLSHCPRLSEEKYVKWTLSITSIHGPRAPLLFVQSIVVSFPERPDLKSAALNKQPFKLKRETLKTNPLVISLKLHFGDGCKCQWTSIKFQVNFEEVAETVLYDKEAIIENLRNLAIEDHCCGQTSLVERNKSAKQEKLVYATTTNMVEYCSDDAASAGSAKHILKRNYNGYVLKRDENLGSSSRWAKKLKAT
ncbi:hypothetical protein L6164_031593 [Bauhinia variegata]|uniref:Uncharacterized protein n=1 Tax=Bauhinia variegata TaxID=167791 RepID=A0ACB9LHF8_BAUVA|nr:hypothetical protein L6164_031593 [Bauhinia variegata]